MCRAASTARTSASPSPAGRRSSRSLLRSTAPSSARTPPTRRATLCRTCRSTGVATAARTVGALAICARGRRPCPRARGAHPRRLPARSALRRPGGQDLQAQRRAQQRARGDAGHDRHDQPCCAWAGARAPREPNRARGGQRATPARRDVSPRDALPPPRPLPPAPSEPILTRRARPALRTPSSRSFLREGLSGRNRKQWPLSCCALISSGVGRARARLWTWMGAPACVE